MRADVCSPLDFLGEFAELLRLYYERGVDLPSRRALLRCREERMRVYASSQLLRLKERARTNYHASRKVSVRSWKLPIRKIRIGRPVRRRRVAEW